MEEIFSSEEAAHLSSSKLEKLVPADQAVRLLQLQGDEKVLEIGAGNGYFTLPIAAATSDRIVAIEPNEQLLDLLAAKLSEKDVGNVDRMPGEIEFLNVPDRSFHRVFAPFIFHKLSDWKKTVTEMERVINEHGRLVILEWIPKMLGEGPSKKESLPADELAEELAGLGFYIEKGELNKQVYYIIADKTEEISETETI